MGRGRKRQTILVKQKKNQKAKKARELRKAEERRRSRLSK